ncbi:MAG: hypothetical protein ACLUD2_18160 [Clostridium sp.]
MCRSSGTFSPSQEMMLMVMVCAVGILCVYYLLHNMSLDYAWEIAIVTGTIAQLAAVFVGDFLLPCIHAGCRSF